MPWWPSKVSANRTEAALTARAAVWSQPFFLLIHTTPEWVVCCRTGPGLTGSIQQLFSSLPVQSPPLFAVLRT